MAWQYPKHVCGHEGPRYQAYGPMERRKWRLMAVENRPCPNCLAKSAGEKAEETGLPALKGSPKHVAWASNLRENMLSDWKDQITIAEELLDDVKASDKAKASLVVKGARRRLDEYLAHDEARWWIDHRDDPSPLDSEVRERMLVVSRLNKN